MDKRSEFESIVREYSEQLYWQIRRIVLTHDDANDVLQNTFLKAWNPEETEKMKFNEKVKWLAFDDWDLSRVVLKK